ncbi:sodium:calcium symporter [Roseiconus nitratireducens]|uniref:Sodium:calcium symporter n=1 Tax=Roseiconus nitratireducens TaxID=2605748 RepID=A0A5M6D1W4_9BACT|nr:sodium-dependent transporter [Roseiconus nitratireducens]KAA5540996.1 sodium:calcium symporter [Roseiconus nitratireducens]
MENSSDDRPVGDAAGEPYRPPESPSAPQSTSQPASDPASSGGEQWGTRIGVILAVAGSAVGLGNFLRFPGQAAQNGGGAFLLPYFISLLVLGIPLCWAEWTMGRFGGMRGFNSAPGIFSVVCRTPKARYLAVPALLIPLVIYMYYVVIEAWCLAYACSYATGALMQGSDPDAYTSFFGNFVGIDQDGAAFSGGTSLMYFVLFTFAVNFVLIYRGVARGIEVFCKFAIPLMVVCALCVLVRVLTLPWEKVEAGLGFMWNPDFAALANAETWLAASGQIFFSLSVGFGVIINYSSYLKKKDDVVLSGLTACSMNEFFEVCLGGLITLPAAFIFLGTAVGSQGTFGLGFNALPNVFAQMPAGQFFGFLWFFMLFLAAITSSLSMLQPVIAFFEEGFGLQRSASVSVLGIIALAGSGFVMYFSAELKALDTFDFWVGTFLIFVLAMIQAVMYGWVFGIERGAKYSADGSHLGIPTFVQYMLKFLVPLYLGVIFIFFVMDNVLDQTDPETGEVTPGYLSKIANDPVTYMSLLFIGGTIVFLTVLVHVAGTRWIRQGRFDEPGDVGPEVS